MQHSLPQNGYTRQVPGLFVWPTKGSAALSHDTCALWPYRMGKRSKEMSGSEASHE